MKFLLIFHNFVVLSRVLKPREILDGVELLLPIASSTTEETTTSSITTFTGQATVIELQSFEILANNKNCNESEFRTKPYFGNFMLTEEPPSLCASTETPTQSTPAKEFHVTDMIRTVTRTITEPLPPWGPRPWGRKPSFNDFTSPCYFYRTGEEIDVPCNLLPPDFPTYFDDFPAMTPPDFMDQLCYTVDNGDVIEIPCKFSFLSNFPEKDSVIIEDLPAMKPWKGVLEPNFPGVNVLGPYTWGPPIELNLTDTEPSWIQGVLPSMEPPIESTTEVKYNETLINAGNNSTPTESSVLNSTLSANETIIPLDAVSTEDEHLATQPVDTNKGDKLKFPPTFILCVLIIYFQ